MKNGVFTISLDFELYWGVHDVVSSAKYSKNLDNAKRACSEILNEFINSEIAATWAIVDALRFRNKEDFGSFTKDYKVQYKNEKFSPFPFQDKMAKEKDDILFAPEIIEKIRNTERQEIATHTFSHSYVLEDGFSSAAFKAELNKSMNCSTDKIESIIFPRNQYATEYLDICQKSGLNSFRGNPNQIAYSPKKCERDFVWFRAMRWMNSYMGNSSKFIHELSWKKGELLNIPASVFLRPCGNISLLDSLRINRIKRLMTVAAKQNKLFHIWWHPHNFGKDIHANINQLKEILKHYRQLKLDHDFQNLNMKEIYKTFSES